MDFNIDNEGLCRGSAVGSVCGVVSGISKWTMTHELDSRRARTIALYTLILVLFFRRLLYHTCLYSLPNAMLIIIIGFPIRTGTLIMIQRFRPYTPRPSSDVCPLTWSPYWFVESNPLFITRRKILFILHSRLRRYFISWKPKHPPEKSSHIFKDPRQIETSYG